MPQRRQNLARAETGRAHALHGLIAGSGPSNKPAGICGWNWGAWGAGGNRYAGGGAGISKWIRGATGGRGGRGGGEQAHRRERPEDGRGGNRCDWLGFWLGLRLELGDHDRLRLGNDLGFGLRLELGDHDRLRLGNDLRLGFGLRLELGDHDRHRLGNDLGSGSDCASARRP